jgi:23S rRNA pseudouridine2605 synthase
MGIEEKDGEQELHPKKSAPENQREDAGSQEKNYERKPAYHATKDGDGYHTHEDARTTPGRRPRIKDSRSVNYNRPTYGSRPPGENRSDGRADYQQSPGQDERRPYPPRPSYGAGERRDSSYQPSRPPSSYGGGERRDGERRDSERREYSPYQSPRPSSSYGGGERREQSSYSPRPNTERGGYQKQERPGGGSWHDSNRPQTQGGRYDSNRPPGQDNRYDSNRPQGQDNRYSRPQGQDSRYDSNRPQGQGGRYDNRPQGQGSRYDSNRPQGQGSRPPYDNRGGDRYSRPQQRTPGYNPNAKYSYQKQLKYKEALSDPNEPIRLNKFLANAGVCSRREADEFIQAGVVKVNGNVITELGTKISRMDTVLFHERAVQIESKLYILLNKPKNCVTTSDDPHERLTVMDLVKSACKERIYPVGRLDRNTTGVLLLTNDGDLASKLTHPSFKKKKIYHVWLDKDVAIEDMEKLATGLDLEDGEIHADAISYANEEDKKEVGIEIHSGKNRVVRRMFESLGYRVIKLDRVYFAGLTKKNLPRGKWRYLNERDVNALRMGAFE